MELYVVEACSDKPVGTYTSSVSPRIGERLDANNGSWIVNMIQHDIRGDLTTLNLPKPIQTIVVVYVQKTL